MKVLFFSMLHEGQQPLLKKASGDIFEGFAVDIIFSNRRALSPDFVPQKLFCRKEQIDQLAATLSPALRGDKPDNITLYGKPGSGKTCVTNFVAKELMRKCAGINRNVKVVYINCNVCRAESDIIKTICAIDGHIKVPKTGISMSDYYKFLWKTLNNFAGVVIVVLDEIDKMRNDTILYTLTRAEEDHNVINSSISIIGITNYINYKTQVDPRVISSYGDTEFVFPPYNAAELRDILAQRAELGFRKGVVSDSVIPLCSALAASADGDARKAIRLLALSGKIAIEMGSNKIKEVHARLAENRLDNDLVSEVIKSLPKQQQALLFCISDHLSKNVKHHASTGEIYNAYRTYCEKTGMVALTQFRISAFIGEFDILGLINAPLVYKGRYGRTREISLGVPNEIMMPMLRELLSCKPFI